MRRRRVRMRRRAILASALPILLLTATTSPVTAGADHPGWLDAYRDPAARIIGEAVGSTFAWQRLSVLTDGIGNRLSGTPALDRAIAWAAAEMTRDGLENVHTE